MSPFHDLGRRCKGPRKLDKEWSAPVPALRARTTRDESPEAPVGSLVGFVRVILLTALGFAGLLSLGVRGVVFLQGYILPAEFHGSGGTTSGFASSAFAGQGPSEAVRAGRDKRIGKGRWNS